MYYFCSTGLTQCWPNLSTFTLNLVSFNILIDLVNLGNLVNLVNLANLLKVILKGIKKKALLISFS